MADSPDLLDIDSLLTAEELAVRAGVRDFVDADIKPNIARWYDAARFPLEIVPRMAELGLLGMQIQGYGCPGRSAVEYGLAALELEAGDSGLRTFVSVQGSLAMSAIAKHGSEEQKNEWLPRMAAGTAVGCFALTEPTAGSDPGNMLTTARRDGSDWILNGSKRWIGLASVAQVAVIWAMRRRRPRLCGAHGHSGVSGHAHHAEAVYARLHSVRRRNHQPPPARGRGAAEGGGAARPVRMPQ